VADTTGQLYFPFPEFSPGSSAAPAPVPMPRPAAGRAEWFEAGLRAEEAGRLEDAACAYGEAASEGRSSQ
jgi:hypothetical protein